MCESESFRPERQRYCITHRANRSSPQFSYAFTAPQIVYNFRKAENLPKRYRRVPREILFDSDFPTVVILPTEISFLMSWIFSGKLNSVPGRLGPEGNRHGRPLRFGLVIRNCPGRLTVLLQRIPLTSTSTVFSSYFHPLTPIKYYFNI